MSDTPPLTPEDLLRQAQQHLQSLKEAGVDWLPLAATPDTPVAVENNTTPAPQPTPEPLPVLSGSHLFTPGQAAAPEMSPEERSRALEMLAEQVSTCSRCQELMVSRTQTVFGEGPLDPDLCFIGEAPGYNEDKQGRPFVGDAGQLLDRIIAACGFRRDEVYIANVLKCRPPGNRTPLVTEVTNCRGYLERQLELVRPKYICCLGASAAQSLLGGTQGISRMRKRFHDYNGIPVLCTFHPAYLLRNEGAKKDVWEDMKMLLNRMGRPIPTPKK